MHGVYRYGIFCQRFEWNFRFGYCVSHVNEVTGVKRPFSVVYGILDLEYLVTFFNGISDSKISKPFGMCFRFGISGELYGRHFMFGISSQPCE